jgi:hypothetical protein
MMRQVCNANISFSSPELKLLDDSMAMMMLRMPDEWLRGVAKL